MLERCRSFSWRNCTGDRQKQKALSATRADGYSPPAGLMLDNAPNPFDLDGLFSHLGRLQIAQSQKCTKCSRRLLRARTVASPRKRMCLVCTISYIASRVYLNTIPASTLEHGLPETSLRSTFLDASVMAAPRNCLQSNCRG